MPTTPPPPRPVVAWMEVLDRIEQVLVESLARAAVPEAPAEAPGQAAHAARLALEALTERQDRLRARLDLAGQDAARAEAALVGEVEAVERWFQEVHALRERLASPGTGA